MPDLSDLHDAFAHLEREIPEHYRSPIIADRVGQLRGGPGVRVRPGRRGPVAMALLAAAAVVTIAVSTVDLTDRSSQKAPVGGQPSSSHSVPVAPASQHNSASTSPSTQHAAPVPADAMPASRRALVRYVRGATTVDPSGYEQAEPGPGRPMRATPGAAEFHTPSGNITCAIVDAAKPGGAAAVMCSAQQFAFHIPSKPASCQHNWAAYFGLVTGGRTSVGACVGGPEFGPTTQALPYGSTIQRHGIGCRSASGFLACADLATGHGFAVNRDTLKIY